MMYEAVITGIIAIITTIAATFYIIRTIQKDLPTRIQEELVDWIAREDNQLALKSYSDALAESVQKRVLGALGGFSSGISREMKSLEGDAQLDSLTELTGNPEVATLINRHLKDKPLLTTLLTSFRQPPPGAHSVPGSPDRSAPNM